MIKVQHSVLISKPVDQVFRFAANYEYDPQWRSEVSQMRYASKEPFQLGAQVVEVSRVLGQNLETITEVVELEPNRRIVSKSIQGQVPLVASREFESAAGGTRFTYILEGDESSVLLFRLFRPLIERWYQGKIESYLRTLKGIIESSSQPQAT